MNVVAAMVIQMMKKKKSVKFGRDEIEVVKEFCYLGDMLGEVDSTSSDYKDTCWMEKV